MSQRSFMPLLVVAALAGGGWYYREPIMAFVNPPPPPPPASAIQPHKDTVYKWVDKDGIVHFDQDNGAGKKAVEIDQGKIQSMSKYGQPGTAQPAVSQQANAARPPAAGEPAKGITGTIPRVKENLNRAENRFQQTQQDYVP